MLVKAREKDGFTVTARSRGQGPAPKTKAVLVNSPSNPTGAVIAPEEMRKILALAKRRKFTVIYDDTYAALTYGTGGTAPSRGTAELAPDRLVVIGTVSKTYCMTGFRIGWVLGPKALVDSCAAFASHSTQGRRRSPRWPRSRP